MKALWRSARAMSAACSLRHCRRRVPGILAGVVLGIGRAIGETMAVVMVAGNKARMPQGLLDGVRTMTANIVMEMGYATDLHREALIATAVVLFVFILMINVTFSLLRRKDRA